MTSNYSSDIDRATARYNAYFENVEPYYGLNGTNGTNSTNGTYVYSFALYPGNYQPSGSNGSSGVDGWTGIRDDFIDDTRYDVIFQQTEAPRVEFENALEAD